MLCSEMATLGVLGQMQCILLNVPAAEATVDTVPTEKQWHCILFLVFSSFQTLEDCIPCLRLFNNLRHCFVCFLTSIRPVRPFLHSTHSLSYTAENVSVQPSQFSL